MSPQRLYTILSLQYLLSYAVYGVILPFAPLIFRGQGLSDSELSLTLGSLGLAACLSPLVISHFADRAVSPVRLVRILSLLTAVELPLWLAVAGLTSAFAIALGFFLLFLPIFTILDTYTLALLRDAPVGRPRYLSYQSARTWGSFGFMLPSLCFYFLPIPTTNASLIAAAVSFSATAALVTLLLPKWEAGELSVSAPSKAAVAFVFSASGLARFFCAIFIAGLAVANFYIIFPRYLQELGFNRPEVGLIINFGVLFELMLLPFAERLLFRFGFLRLTLLGLGALALRLVILGAVPLRFAVIASQVLHAPMVLALFVAAPIYLQRVCPRDCRFSLQSLYSSTVFGLARLIGPLLLAGVLVLNVGGQLETLRLASLLSSVLVLVGLILVKGARLGEEKAEEKSSA